MSRYLGPLRRKARSLKLPLLKATGRGKRGASTPGMHSVKRRTHSNYALQNQAKQQLRFLYGVREKQLHNEFKKLWKINRRSTENIDIGDKLLISYETRLDSLILQARVAPTRAFARLWVGHGHFLVDGKKVKSCSYKVKVGQKISFRKAESLTNETITNSIKNNPTPVPYVSVDKTNMTITLLRKPSIDDKLVKEIKAYINTSLAKEWYSRKI